MPYTTFLKNHDQFIYCQYTGPFALEPLIDLAKEVNEFCISEGYRATLVDITESFGEMGDFSRFNHGAIISKFVERGFQVALLARTDQLSDHFWENVTRNRLLKTKVFTNRQKAENWLCAESDL